MIVRDVITDRVIEEESTIYRKDGMLTVDAFNEDFVMRKRIAGDGYVEYSRINEIYVVKGFAPKFFCQEFDDRRDADKFYRSLR